MYMEDKLQQTNFSVQMLTGEEAFALCRKFYEQGAADKEKEIKNSISKKESEEYITKADAMKLLRKSSNCLWKWDKKGYLCSVKHRGSVMYRKSDVVHILEGGK